MPKEPREGGQGGEGDQRGGCVDREEILSYPTAAFFVRDVSF